MNYKLNKIIRVEYTSVNEQVFDIEIDHPSHAFIAQSVTRSQRNFT
jgi:hypothetical protein